MHVFIGNFTYIVDFMIVEDISSIIDPRLSQVVLGKPFVKISNMTHDPPEGVVRFTNGTDEVAYKMPHMIEQYNSLSDLEKEHTKSVYLRNEEDKRRGVEYVMSKILGFYKECLELGPEYATGIDDKGDFTIDQGVGSTSGIRACALRNFDLGKMELENSQNNALAKLPMLKLGEYEMWEIRIKQYFQIQDYALWEVIENGNSWVPIPVTTPESGPSTALKMTVPSTTEEKICKKNDVKARSLLLMALPNEHQLTFNQYADDFHQAT
ncbi:hypothetical protein Tco_1150253 [Tanacetum coccineum]